MVSMTPYVRGAELLGPGKADQIQVNVRGGEAVGGVVDVGRGEYVQLIEHRAGESPTVSATAAGVTSQELVVNGGRGASNTARMVAYLLGLLLLVALVVIGYLARRGGGGRTVSRG